MKPLPTIFLPYGFTDLRPASAWGKVTPQTGYPQGGEADPPGIWFPAGVITNIWQRQLIFPANNTWSGKITFGFTTYVDPYRLAWIKYAEAPQSVINPITSAYVKAETLLTVELLDSSLRVVARGISQPFNKPSRSTSLTIEPIAELAGNYTTKNPIVFDQFNRTFDGEPGFIRWQYTSNDRNPFVADVDPATIALSNLWPVVFVPPNIALSAKFGGSSFGPEAISRASAFLDFAQTLSLRAESKGSASSFCNAEIDEELNLRGLLNASATAGAQLLGPIDLSAQSTSVVSSNATSTFVVGLFANGSALSINSTNIVIGSSVFLQAAATATAKTKEAQNLQISERVSGMTMYVSLDTREFVVSPVLTAPVESMKFTRRDNVAIDLKFVRDGEVVELGFGASGKIGVKNEFSGAALALDGAWQQKGEGRNTSYQFALNLNTEELNDLFVTDEENSVTAKVEVEWTEAGTINTTLPCAAIVLNDVLRGTEGAPTIATPGTFSLADNAGGVWSISIDSTGVLTATKQ